MVNLKKLFAVGLAAASISTLNASAYNYIGDKKYSLKEFESEFVSSFAYTKDDNIYLADFDGEHIYSLEEGETITIKETDKEFFKEIESFHENEEYTSYEHDSNIGESNKFAIVKYDMEGNTLDRKEILLEGIEPGNTDVYVIYFDEVIITDVYNIETEEFEIHKFDLEGKLIDKITYEKILETLNENKENKSVNYMNVYTFQGKIYYNININEYTEDSFYQTAYILDEEYNTIIKIEPKKAGYDIDLTLIPSGNEIKAIYVLNNYADEKAKSSFHSIDSQGNVKDILTDKNEMISLYDNGFIYVEEYILNEETGETNYKNHIYDNNLNFIKTYNESVHISKVISSKDEFKDYMMGSDKPLSNGKYIISNFKYEYNEDGSSNIKIFSSELLTVEDVSRVNITGFVKDANNTPLKGVTVELHSTVRTVVTDEYGYFKFENVEEGDHTITIKDASGNVLATKELKVILGDETKLDGNTLYFSLADNGLNLNIKLNGTELSIDSLDKGIKTPEVPKTFDSLTKNIIMLITLMISTLIIAKKYTKVKYIKN